MLNDRRVLLDLLLASGSLRFGDFTLKSGQASPFFLNLGGISRGSHLHQLGEILAHGLRQAFPDATMLMGPPYKGIALATVLAESCWRLFGWDLHTCYFRKERKAHGEAGSFVGTRPGLGDRLVIVDDVVSSGGTKVEAVGLLRSAFGLEPVGVLVVLDRRQAGTGWDPSLPELASLLDLRDLAACLRESLPERADIIQDYYQGRP